MIFRLDIGKTDSGKGRAVEFAFTPEQQQLRKSVREFAEGEIAPHVMEWDEASHFPMEIMPKLADQLDSIAFVRSVSSWAAVHGLAPTWPQIGRHPT